MLLRLSLTLLCVLGYFSVIFSDNPVQPLVSRQSAMYSGLPSITSTSSGRPALNGIRCSLATQSALYTKGEPIPATVTITNQSDVVAKVPVGTDLEGALRITIKRPNGSIVNAPQIVPSNLLSRMGTIALKTNETYSQGVILNKWHEFNDIGIYNITWRTVGSKSESSCESENLYLEIGLYNPLRLSEVCENLLATISESSANNIEAAKQMIVINDPLVVKYLSRAHNANPAVDFIIIEGLENIADRAAIEILIGILNEATADSSSFGEARAALESVAKKERNPELLEMIRNAIKSNLKRIEPAGQKSPPVF